VPGIEECMAQAMAIPGAVRAVLADAASGMLVSAAGQEGPVGAEADAAGGADLIRAVLTCPALLPERSDDDVSEIIISGPAGFHLFALIGSRPDGPLLIHLRIQGDTGNLAMARHRMRSIIAEVSGP